MTDLRALHAASPEATELLRRIGEAEASLRVWRLLLLDDRTPTCVDGEWRAVGYGKLRDVRQGLRQATEIVEALIVKHPDEVDGPGAEGGTA